MDSYSLPFVPEFIVCGNRLLDRFELKPIR
jgi:hypothetical protein